MLWNLGQMDGSAEIGVRVFWMGSQKRILELASVWSDTPFLHMHIISRYHRQQNKSYPQRCLLAHFEVTLNFSRSEFTCPAIITEVKFVTAVKFQYRVLQLTAVFLTICHLWG